MPDPWAEPGSAQRGRECGKRQSEGVNNRAGPTGSRILLETARGAASRRESFGCKDASPARGTLQGYQGYGPSDAPLRRRGAEPSGALRWRADRHGRLRCIHVVQASGSAQERGNPRARKARRAGFLFTPRPVRAGRYQSGRRLASGGGSESCEPLQPIFLKRFRDPNPAPPATEPRARARWATPCSGRPFLAVLNFLEPR